MQKKRSRTVALSLWVAIGLLTGVAAFGQVRATQQSALDEVRRLTPELIEANQAIWDFAEVGLEEKRSANLLVTKLRAAGFEVRQGVSGMPTAFVASFGSGKPVIGILAEYDALPGMSQTKEAQRAPLQAGASGHACGHCALGTAALGAALAAKAAMETHKLPGTIRLYGTPAEETLIGKVYMCLDKQFDDLDVCLHWHPATMNAVWAGSSKAVVSVRFTFTGTSAHASADPENGRSALDAVELMNVAANYMREHVKEDARIHYVITDGGGAPNVIPPTASVWYYVRANSHEDVEYYFRWVADIARGAAIMTRTEVKTVVETDCHELIPNTPLADLLFKNMNLINAPQFTDDERAFARKLQKPLEEQFQKRFAEALEEKIRPLADSSGLTKGSTDVGDISWRVPTSGIRTTCFPSESPGHSWQNVACVASTIGEKGMLYAAQVLAIAAIDLLEDPKPIEAAKADLKRRLDGRQYSSLIPQGQKAPARIR